MAYQAQDDAFREIQLNGKQLVFLFMVATVVSVVIFLCGVFVGRGVRAERAPMLADTSSVSSTVTTPDAAPAAQAQAPAPAGSDPTVAAPPPAVDELSYFERLGKSGQPSEDLKPTPPKAEAPPKAPAAVVGKAASRRVEKPVPPAQAASAPFAREAGPAPAHSEPAAAKSTSPVAAAASAEPAGQGFALQVGALRERKEAEAIARRLSSKGYTAYVVTPQNGATSVYRVRVGKFKTRREAETVATRLKKEEQFQPWITR